MIRRAPTVIHLKHEDIHEYEDYQALKDKPDRDLENRGPSGERMQLTAQQRIHGTEVLKAQTVPLSNTHGNIN